MSIQKSEAILLSKREIRETSSIAVFFTKEYGKIKGLLKGVRGQQAGFGLYLREFAKYDIVYYEKKKSETFMVTQCDLKDPFIEISEDFDKRLKAYYALELVDKFTPLQEKSFKIYSLLCWIFDSMRKERFADRALIIFQLKLLEYAGFLPVLEECANCSKDVLKSAYFSVRLSGLLCGGCRDADIQATPLSKGAIASINMIRKQNLDQLGRTMITKEISAELKKLLERFVAYHLGEHLRSYDFIQEVEARS